MNFRAFYAVFNPVMQKRVFSTPSRVFVHPSATLIGNVKLSNDVSIWPFVVLRGDVNSIVVGESSNIQVSMRIDGTVIHVTGDWEGANSGSSTEIGARVSIGHMAMLHGCRIKDDVLIGMKSTVMDKAIVSSNTIIGAGSLVPPGKILESGYLYVGTPVKKIRQLKSEEIRWIQLRILETVT